MKNERGFTLMEMVIALGVIAIIGSLLVSSVVTINSNTKTADLTAFLDGVTNQAREVFAANADKVITNSFSSTDASLYPYTSMAYQALSENEIHYTQSYTDNLHTTTINDVNEKYRMVIAFHGTDVSDIPSGFSFKTKTFEMEANVYENIEGNLTKEPLYTKVYTFDNITTSAYPTVGEVKKVTFQGNGGCIVERKEDTSCLGTSKQKDYFKGDSLYSAGVDRTPAYAGYKQNNLFIGWSLGAGDRNLLGNDFKVMNDTSVYAQYLEANQYRLEFQISGDERFNVAGISGDAATKPYYVEKASVNKPVISNMETNISRFFVDNAVRKNGYKFDYWEDASGNKVTPNTVMNQQYMILYPHFTPLDDGNQEMLSLNLTLDLNNVVASNDGGVSRLFALYPFTKMEYSIKYDKTTDSFTLAQKEMLNKDLNSLSNLSKGFVMSDKSFNSKNNVSNLYLTGANGTKFSTFSEYVQNSLSDPNHTFSIADVRLQVKMPSFSLGDYYDASSAKDSLRAVGSGITLDKKSASSLFNNPETGAEFTFLNNIPMEPNSLDAINDKIAALTHDVGSFYNTGTISFSSSTSTSYDSYTIPGKVTPPTKKSIVDKHIAKYDYYITIPLSILDDKKSKIGVNVGEVYQWINSMGDICISYELRYNDKNKTSVIDLSTGKEHRITTINTGIPYKSITWQNGDYAKDPNGNYIYQYAKLRSINFTIDGLRPNNGSNKMFARLEDLHITQSEANVGTSPYNGNYEASNPIWGGYGSDAWWTLDAVYGGYQHKYSYLFENPSLWNPIDKPTVVRKANRAGNNDYARPGEWSDALYSGFERYNPCGNGTMAWVRPDKMWPACVVPYGDSNTPSDNKKLFADRHIETGPETHTFKYDVTVPGKQEPDVNVISFSKPNAKQNYLPPFIASIPFDKK